MAKHPGIILPCIIKHNFYINTKSQNKSSLLCLHNTLQLSNKNFEWSKEQLEQKTTQTNYL